MAAEGSSGEIIVWQPDVSANYHERVCTHGTADVTYRYAHWHMHTRDVDRYPSPKTLTDPDEGIKSKITYTSKFRSVLTPEAARLRSQEVALGNYLIVCFIQLCAAGIFLTRSNLTVVNTFVKIPPILFRVQAPAPKHSSAVDGTAAL